MQISSHAKSRAAIVSLLALTSLAVLSAARPAQAQLTLTPQGTTLGFSLSTFASGFPSISEPPAGIVGPIGIAFPSAGGVLVADTFGDVRLFPTDTNGQNAATTPVEQHYNHSNNGGNNAFGLAQVGSNIYMTQQGLGDVVQVNPNGTVNQNIVGGLGSAVGIAADPVNGHLFVSSDSTNGSIFDVNPIAKTEKTLVTGVDIDGLSVSSNGTTLYAADNQTGHIYEYNTSTGTTIFDSGPISGGVDGTAVGYGTLAGDLFVNNNNGTVDEINLATHALTQIASGGSRGDFVTVDSSNDTLLLTQSDRILRLTPGSGGFGPAPEPSSFIDTGFALTGIVGLLLMARKRTRKA